MKRGSRGIRVKAAAAGLALAGALLCWAQSSASQDGSLIQSVPTPRHPGLGGDTANDLLYGPKRIQALNADRQKSMVSDTEKLVKLARRLEEEIASNPTGNLTLEELHQAAEIEKLARNVKEKMARSFDPGPRVGSSFTPLAGPNRQ